jgi:hypothetical protein
LQELQNKNGIVSEPAVFQRRQETGDRRQETGDRRQETGDRRQETGDRRKETGDRRQETVFWRAISLQAFTRGI